jgi:hypothetical protein
MVWNSLGMFVLGKRKSRDRRLFTLPILRSRPVAWQFYPNLWTKNLKTLAPF